MLGAGAGFGPWRGGSKCSLLEDACSGGNGCADSTCGSITGELYHILHRSCLAT